MVEDMATVRVAGAISECGEAEVDDEDDVIFLGDDDFTDGDESSPGSGAEPVLQRHGGSIAEVKSSDAPVLAVDMQERERAARKARKREARDAFITKANDESERLAATVTAMMAETEALLAEHKKVDTTRKVLECLEPGSESDDSELAGGSSEDAHGEARGSSGHA